MCIVSLKPSFEKLFWQYVSEDIPHHFFFAFDWKHNRNGVEIPLALENNKTDGTLLIYK